jgi:adenylate cyclase
MDRSRPSWQGWRLVLAASLLAAPWLGAGDATVRSLLFRLRGPGRPPAELVILDVDQDSVALSDRLTPEEIAASPLWRRMGPWPWPRRLQADLAAEVLERGARQVVFTLLYPQPSSFGPADDQAFLHRLAPWRDRVVLIAGYGAEQDPASGLELVQLRWPVVELGSVGLDALLEGATGAIESIPGGHWQQHNLADFPLPHPPALAFAAAGRVPPGAVLGLNFLGPAGTVPTLSAWQVQQQPSGFWQDRIVVIGRTPSRLADRRPSPFGPLIRLQLQGVALATVLQGRGFQPVPCPVALPLRRALPCPSAFPCRSTIRSTSCSARAPRACPSPSCTATAASPSSTSRR